MKDKSILQRVRDLLKRGKIELDLSLPHVLTEARKDGLTTDDLEAAVMAGEVIRRLWRASLVAPLRNRPSDSCSRRVILRVATNETFSSLVDMPSALALCSSALIYSRLTFLALCHSHERMEFQLWPDVRLNLNLHAARADGIPTQKFQLFPRGV